MTNIGTLIMSSALLVPFVGWPAQYPVHRESSAARTLRFAGTGVHTLDVRVTSGTIHVTGSTALTCRSSMHEDFGRDRCGGPSGRARVATESTDGAADHSRRSCMRRMDRRAASACRPRPPGGIGAATREVDCRFVCRATRLRVCAVNGGELASRVCRATSTSTTSTAASRSSDPRLGTCNDRQRRACGAFAEAPRRRLF